MNETVILFVLFIYFTWSVTFGHLVRRGPLNDFDECMREFQEYRVKCERDKAEMVGKVERMERKYQDIIDTLMSKIFTLEQRIEYLENRP